MEQDSFDAIIPVGGGLVSYRMKYSDVIKIDDFEKFSSIESRPVAHDSHSGTCAICLEEFEEGEFDEEDIASFAKNLTAELQQDLVQAVMEKDKD